MRRAADAARASLVLGALALVLAGDTHEAFGMALVAVTAIVLRAAAVPPQLDATFIGLLALDSWLTSLGAFDSFNREDRPGHAILCALATLVLRQLALQLGVLAQRPRPQALAAIAYAATVAALGIALGTAWELVEYGADATLGTNMSLSDGDTMGDLVADAAGATVAALAVTWHAVARARTTTP